MKFLYFLFLFVVFNLPIFGQRTISFDSIRFTDTLALLRTREISNWGGQSISENAEFYGYKGKTAWIIDSGIWFDHPDIPNVCLKYSKSFSFVRNGYSNLIKESLDKSYYKEILHRDIKGDTLVDDEGNPLIDTIYNDYYGHGTLIAGIIGAKKNNKIGITGIAPGVKLIALQVLDFEGRGDTLDLISALEYVQKHAKVGDVVNISMVIEAESNSTLNKIKSRVESIADKNVYVVLPSTDERISKGHIFINMLKSSPNILVVGAIRQDGSRKISENTFIKRGKITHEAPGYNIYSTNRFGGYALCQGSSIAAAHISGLLLRNWRAVSKWRYRINRKTY